LTQALQLSLIAMPLWIEYAACMVCAVSGVLAAKGKQMDLFGAIMLALATALGGGTIRDLCLGVQPVFWVAAPDFLTCSLIAAVATFTLAPHLAFPERALNVADAFGLALFGIIGTEKAMTLEAPVSVAILMGILTGVAGGIVRDVLRNELPKVFRTEIYLYSTAIFGGAGIYVLMVHSLPPSPSHRYVGMAIILALRLAAMRWRLGLPVYRGR
jgi:uncharacterized membrane protein YeiH